MSFKNAVSKLAKLGFKVAESDPLAKKLDDIVQSMDPQTAAKGLSGLNPAQQNTIITSYKKFIDARPDGMTEREARNVYLKTVREEAFPDGPLGNEPFRTYRQQLLDGVRVSNGKDPLPPRATPAGKAETPKAEGPKAPANAGGGNGNEPPGVITPELKAAQHNISASLLDMRTIRNTNGKMNKTEFFADLMGSLRETNMLKLTTEEIAAATRSPRQPLTTPKQVFEALERRQMVTESEVGTLSDYFARNHHDSKLSSPPQNSQHFMIPGQGRVVQGIDMLARNIHIKEGKANRPTFAQNFEWEQGRTPGPIVNFASNFQEKPIITTGKVIGAGYMAYAIGTTALTAMNPQDPYFAGKHVFGALTADQHKEVDDYSEYLLDRYNTNPQMALEDLKKYYGIDVSLSKDGKLGPEASEAILKGTSPPYEPSGYVTQALTMFVAQRVYGKAVATSEELLELRRATAEKGQKSTVDKARQTETTGYEDLARRLANNRSDITKAPENRPSLNMDSVFEELTQDDSQGMKGKRSVLESAWQKATTTGSVDNKVLEKELEKGGIAPAGREVVKSWAQEYTHSLAQ